MKKLIFISILALSLVSVSCRKDAGNADMSTVDFIVQATDWQKTLDYDYGTVGYGYYVDLDFPELTDNVIQNGMVSLYMKDNNTWIPVPIYFYSQVYTDQGDLVFFQGGYFYRMQKGVFSIEYYENDGQTANPGNQIFKLVIVQPK